MISRVLLGYDGSPAAARAFDFAVDLAKPYGGERIKPGAEPFDTLFDSQAIVSWCVISTCPGAKDIQKKRLFS